MLTTGGEIHPDSIFRCAFEALQIPYSHNICKREYYCVSLIKTGTQSNKMLNIA